MGQGNRSSRPEASEIEASIEGRARALDFALAKAMERLVADEERAACVRQRVD
jgi:hypothetical protein